MQKLTHLEAQEVIQEAYRLKAAYKEYKSRLGQAIWWCATNQIDPSLPENLVEKLSDLVNADRGTLDDFYYWSDDTEIIKKFYELYVEQY